MKIRKSINSARGYFDDRVNAENNKKVLQTLRTAMFELYDGQTIGNSEIIVDDVKDGVVAGNCCFNIYFVDIEDPSEEYTLVVTSTAQSMGKFLCILTPWGGTSEPYGRDPLAIEKFIISMSGSKDALSHEIKRIAGGIFNDSSQGVESSMKIRRNRVTANKRRTVKAAYKELRSFDAYGYDEDGELAYEGLPYALDSIDEVTAWLKAMLAGVEEFKSEWSEWGGSTSEIEMFSGPSDAEDFGVKMYSDIIQNGLEPLAKELGDLLNVYIYPDDSDY